MCALYIKYNYLHFPSFLRKICKFLSPRFQITCKKHRKDGEPTPAAFVRRCVARKASSLHGTVSGCVRKHQPSAPGYHFPCCLPNVKQG